MQYRRLGSSEFDVSVLAFGAWQLGDPGYWGADAQADGNAAVHAAIEAGINLFDTAEAYGDGESERALGRALGARRREVLIASKVSSANCAPGRLRRACEGSLRRLGTEWIDLYQVHWPCREVPFEDANGELQRLQTEGKIRAVGVSNFGPLDLDAWMACGGCVSNQLGYSPAFRAAEYAAVPACLRHGVGILAYMPLLQGILSCRWKSADDVPQSRRRTRHFAAKRPGVRHGDPGCEALLFEMLAQLSALADEIGRPAANVALAWLAAQRGVTSLIIGARNPAQLKRNVAAADLVLNDQTLGRIDALTLPLKEALGCNLDMWVGEKESRIR